VILVCGFRVLGVPALLAGQLLGKRCILKADSRGELSGVFFDPGLARFRLRHDRFPVRLALRVRNALLRRAARFVAISRVIEQEYLACGVPASRIARIPNSMNPDLFRPAPAGEKTALRRRLGLGTERPIVTYTGRLVTTKGLPSLLRSWRSVIERRPDALLVLVGSGGLGLQNCEDALKRYTNEHALEDTVLFTGSVENVHEYLQASDVFVFPTEREAFGISIIEAMGCGLPIVTTRVEGVMDVVRSGIDALLVTAGDDDALASAIETALGGGPAVAAMSSAARERAVRAYSSPAVVTAYRELFAGVLK
jgi:glycosyltransferase involved in cell wall biosynthesis